RKGRNDVREQENRQEQQQDQAEQLRRQDVADPLGAAEVVEQTVEDREETGPEDHADRAEEQRPGDARRLPEAALRRADRREEEESGARGAHHVGAVGRHPRRGMRCHGLHHASTAAMSEAASSATASPPVTLRKISSSPASPASACRLSSSIVPIAWIRPPLMIAIRSQSASATSSVCVERKTVPPWAVKARKRSLIRRAAFGSRPTIGSSTTISSGWWTNAELISSFCRIPWL